MKIRTFLIILIVTTVFSFASCAKANDDKAAIQIWCYDYSTEPNYYSSALALIISNIKSFCEKNEIPFEIIRYDEKTLSYEDYALKRNIAAAQGNMIIIEDARYISGIAKHHTDYSKLDNYNILLDMYKDKFCIPLGVNYWVAPIYNEAINHYGINTDKSLISYEEFLEIKQKMKENGAKFKLNSNEFKEMIEYNLNKYGLRFINDESKVLEDKAKFKESLKNVIIGMCDDIILYNDSIAIDDNYLEQEDDIVIYDEKAKLTLMDSVRGYLLSNYSSVGNFGESILGTTFYINPGSTYYSPCFYMHKKITNDKIYDLANYLVKENTYLQVTDRSQFYSPVFDGDKTRKLLELDDNWEYTGGYKINADRGQEKDKKMVVYINDIYKFMVKDKEKYDSLASYYFTNIEYLERIFDFVKENVIELSGKGYDYKNNEVNKTLNNNIDKFVTDFSIHYK